MGEFIQKPIHMSKLLAGVVFDDHLYKNKLLLVFCDS